MDMIKKLRTLFMYYEYVVILIECGSYGTAKKYYAYCSTFPLEEDIS